MKARLATIEVDGVGTDGQTTHDVSPAAGLTTRDTRRLLDRAARRLGDRGRRALLLPGAHRQRRLPAHGDRAPLGARAGAARRLHAAPGRGGERLSGLHARRQPDRPHHHRRRRARAKPARPRRDCRSRSRPARTCWPDASGTTCRCACTVRRTSRSTPCC